MAFQNLECLVLFVYASVTTYMDCSERSGKTFSSKIDVLNPVSVHSMSSEGEVLNWYEAEDARKELGK